MTVNNERTRARFASVVVEWRRSGWILLVVPMTVKDAHPLTPPRA
jgi:hypothetical protein